LAINSINITPDDIKITKSDTDAFLNTNLNDYLNTYGITKIIIAGLQTEYCIDTMCRRAYSLGYEVTLVSDAHSTYDNRISAPQMIAHHNEIISNLFGSTIPTNQILFYSKKLLTSSA
jgi:nicotinamidase-related amidase